MAEEPAGQGRAGLGLAGLVRAGQGWAVQAQAQGKGKGRAGQGRAGQGRAAHGKAGRGGAGPSCAGGGGGAPSVEHRDEDPAAVSATGCRHAGLPNDTVPSRGEARGGLTAPPAYSEHLSQPQPAPNARPIPTPPPNPHLNSHRSRSPADPPPWRLASFARLPRPALPRKKRPLKRPP